MRTDALPFHDPWWNIRACLGNAVVPFLDALEFTLEFFAGLGCDRAKLPKITTECTKRT